MCPYFRLGNRYTNQIVVAPIKNNVDINLTRDNVAR